MMVGHSNYGSETWILRHALNGEGNPRIFQTLTINVWYCVKDFDIVLN